MEMVCESSIIVVSNDVLVRAEIKDRRRVPHVANHDRPRGADLHRGAGYLDLIGDIEHGPRADAWNNINSSHTASRLHVIARNSDVIYFLTDYWHCEHVAVVDEESDAILVVSPLGRVESDVINVNEPGHHNVAVIRAVMFRREKGIGVARDPQAPRDL